MNFLKHREISHGAFAYFVLNLTIDTRRCRMGYLMDQKGMEKLMKQWQKDYEIYAPQSRPGEGMYSDTEVIYYGKIDRFSSIEFERKSDYSFKEVLLPISQTLFYFTEDTIKEATIERTKDALVFLRSCDLHALRRLDTVYLQNGFEDYYYKRLRERVKFIVIGCKESFENCFCVSMASNQTQDYDLAINLRNGIYEVDAKWESLTPFLEANAINKQEVSPDYVEENAIKVDVPKNLSLDIMKATLWDEYNERCINCGRCNFVCPTCTCFTMQDIFYTDNGSVGERRRVHASCMVDGYTDVAGGVYRKTSGERMRFRVLHKVYDYKKRNGETMCIGCGRCDDVCPQYISFSHCMNKLEAGMKEVSDEC